MSFPNMDRRTSLPLAISAARRPSTHVTPLEPAHRALAERERERYRDRSHCTPSPHTTPQKPSVAAFGSTSASALGIASASASGSVSASGSSTGASGGGRGSTSGRGSVGTRTPQSLSAYRLPTTSPPSERLRRLAPKPVIIPPLPGAVAGMGVGGKLELGGALRRGSKGRVGKESEGTGRKGRKEGREGSGEETQDDGDAKSRGTGVYAARGRDGQGSRRVEVQGDAVQAGASRLVSVVGLGIDMGFSPSHHPLEGNDERAEESGSEAGQRWRGPGQTKKRRKVSDGRDTEAQTGMEEMLEIGGLDEFEFAPCLGSTTYDPDRASRESSYISYDETRASSVSTTSSFGFDTGPPYPAGPITHSPGTFGLALAPSDDEDEKGGRRRYEYKIASPRSVDARRHAPDVPQEVVCPVWSSSGYSSGSSRYHTGKGSTPPSMGVNGSGHTNEIGSSSGSDDIDSFFLDLRPAARQGDELLSPQTYIANHTPRAVLVQFRDVFGGGDTLAPHLPAASRTHRSAPGGPDDDYAFPPRCLPADGGVMMVREESLAASFTETFGVGSHQAAAAPPSIPLADTMPPRVPEPTRPSLDVLPAHVSRRHSRTASRADSDHSFTFSAYMRSDDGDAESIRGGTRPSEESSRARSTSLRRRVRGLEMERLVPDMIFGESPAMDEIITPEMRISRLPEMAPRPSECEGMSTGMKALLGQGKESSTGGIGLGLGLNLGTQPMGEERYGDDVDDPPSPTPHSGRLSKEQLARIRSGDGLYRPDDTASALKITLNRPAPARPIPSGATDIRASPIPVSRNVTRPGTAVSDRPKGARQYKSFPNLKGRRPSTAPHDTNTFPDLPHTFARENEGRQGLVSSVSHNVFSATTPVKQYPPLSPSAKGKMKYTEARDGAAAPLSARSVVEAQQAITGATPNSAFSIDNFGVAGKGKDSRWKGNLKADVDIAGLVVARCTTINLWADQNSRESISTLYPIKLHSAARARQIDLEIGTSTSPTNAQTKVGKGAKGDGGNANDTDAFWIDGCVEFGMDPRARDKWMFRYGTLESWPLLKRITVNGSQNLDYVSRYASLHLKQAGIYTVRGSEKDGAEWRMRYMVSTGPPCLRADDRCIVIMAFYVNAPFLRGLHANKVGLASSLAKTMRPPIHAVKISTPQLIQASQVPVVPQIQLDAAGNETDARDLVAARPAGPPISRVPAGDAIGGGAADPASQLVDRANLPKRSTSIKRSAGRMAPMSPASSTTGEISQLRPRMTSRRPSTANSAIPHGTPTFKTSPASPIATPPAGGKAKESLMTTVRRRAATVWTRPSTAISSSPLAGSGTPVTTSPGVGSGQGTPGMSSCSPPIDPPNSAASGSSFSTAIGSFLKSKRSLANLKRSPDMDMTPTKAGGSVRPPMPGAMTMIDPTLRAPLSARAVNVHGRSAGVPTAPASSSGVAGQGRLAVDQNGQGHLRMHSAGSSIRLGTAVWPVGGRAVRPSTASGPTGQAIPGEFTKTSAFLVNRGPANQGGIGNRIIGESGSIREEAMGMDRSPPVAGGSRNLATGASGRRRPSTANGVGNGGLGERSGYGRLAG